MAAEVKAVAPLRAAPGPAPETVDTTYWKTFKNQLLLPSPHNAGITSITIPDHNPSGSQADTFAITSGSRVQVYSTKTRKLVKTISRFGVDDTARSGVLRRDGRILLAGGDSGIVQAFDTGSRAILNQKRGEHAHKLPVHVVRWSPSVVTDFVSCSDDRTVRVWDLTEDVPKWTGVGHEDYVRTGGYLPGQGGNMVVSGSYDQTVRIWDTRQQGGRSALTFKFANKVEDILTLNSSSLAVAAGNEVSIVNIVAGCAEHVIASHQKDVMALASAQNGTRILTGGLDGHVKIHNTASWEVVAAFKYPSPILSLAVVPGAANSDGERDDRHLAVGLQSGLLSLRTRLAGTEKAKVREREKKMAALVAGEADEYERKQKKKDTRQGILARDRGKDYKGEGADIVITGNDRPRQKKLKEWQKSLRTGQYAKALDQVVPPDGWRQFSSDELFTLITVLRHRSALRTALADRSAYRLVPIMTMVHKYLTYPQHVNLMYDVLLIVLDLYSHKLGDWQNDDGSEKDVVVLVHKIKARVRQAADWATAAHRTLGMVDVLESG